ncbi:WxcM-like domain-containing protein [uncultured Christiangramia sp.]|uniref:WxcM-like domain-containing protein n=1 Tax=uncultured Christiangramia sp. TaxID=503836 RepID=UPI00345CD322
MIECSNLYQLFEIPHITDHRGVLAYFETGGQINFKIKKLEIVTLDQLTDQKHIDRTSKIALVPINGCIHLEVSAKNSNRPLQNIRLDNHLGIVLPVSTRWRIIEISMNSKFVILYS